MNNNTIVLKTREGACFFFFNPEATASSLVLVFNIKCKAGHYINIILSSWYERRYLFWLYGVSVALKVIPTILSIAIAQWTYLVRYIVIFVFVNVYEVLLRGFQNNEILNVLRHSLKILKGHPAQPWSKKLTIVHCTNVSSADCASASKVQSGPSFKYNLQHLPP